MGALGELREGPQVHPSDPQIYQNFDKFGGAEFASIPKSAKNLFVVFTMVLLCFRPLADFGMLVDLCDDCQDTEQMGRAHFVIGIESSRLANGACNVKGGRRRKL